MHGSAVFGALQHPRVQSSEGTINGLKVFTFKIFAIVAMLSYRERPQS